MSYAHGSDDLYLERDQKSYKIVASVFMNKGQTAQEKDATLTETSTLLKVEHRP